MTEYGKLVRDKIPQIIRAQGETPHIRVLEGPEFHDALERKLQEEAAEYLESRELTELADILEVVCALCQADGQSLEELTAAYQRKNQERGGFAERIFLLSKD